MFIKDIKSLISLKRENYESLFWAATLFVLFLYLLSFKPLLLLLIIITISFSYLKKRFIPLYIILLLIPLVLNILTEKYDMYEVNLSKVDKLAIEVIQTDILATKSQLNILKDNESFFSNIAIAYNYKKDSKYAASLKYYKKALKIKKMGFIYNNMANIYAITNQKDKAIFNYNEAKYYSDEAIYFYNLSKLYFRDKNKERGEYSLELANNISKKLVNKYHSISTFNHNRFYLDKFPKYKESLAIYKSLKELGEKDTYLSLFTFTQKAYFINLGIAIAFFIFLQLLFRRKLAAGYCQRCSITFNSLDISVKHSSFDLCPQCHSMMSTRSSLKKEDLIKKEKEIRFRKKIINIRDVIVNALVPGSFIYYKNNRYLGVVFILWHSYYLVVVVSFYSKWKLVITENFFNFSTIIFGILELSVYLYTYYKLKTRS